METTFWAKLRGLDPVISNDFVGKHCFDGFPFCRKLFTHPKVTVLMRTMRKISDWKVENATDEL